MTSKVISAIKFLRSVFKNKNYIVTASGLAIFITLIFFLTSTLILNFEFLSYIFTSEIFDLKSKAQLFWGLLVATRLNFSLGSLVIMIVLSILLAMDISLFIYYLRGRMAVWAETGVGILGLLVGILGIGCSVCGSIIISFILGFATATILIGFLPFGGLEFGIIGVFLLLFSIYLAAIKIQQSDSCKIS